MILCIVGIVHGYDLLPYYLDHYRMLGVHRFVVACDPETLDPTGRLSDHLRAQPDIVLDALPKSFRRSQLVGFIEEEMRRKHAGPDDWIIPADLDELNQYPLPLPTLIAEFEANDFTHMGGVMRDRISPDGTLAPLLPFDQGVSIWRQYPWEADATALIAGGWTDKVLLSKGDVELSAGHHFPRYRESTRPATHTGVAHHFKWRSELQSMLDWRIENEKRARMPWQKDSITLERFFKSHDRFDLQGLGATYGWQP
jgi:hypothetical protein